MGSRSSTNSAPPSLFGCPALPHLSHCRSSTFPYLVMGKRGYREWTPTEEARLPHWVVLHPEPEWSWDMRAKEYSKTVQPRTAESLRSKLRQLRKNIKRRRPVRRRQARTAQGMTAKQARKEQQRTRERSSIATTRVPTGRMHTNLRDIGAVPEQAESRVQAVPTAEFSKSPPMTQVGMRSPVRNRALARSVQGKINIFQTAPVSALTLMGHVDSKASSLSQPPVRGPSRTMDLVWQVIYQFAGRTRPRSLGHPRH